MKPPATIIVGEVVRLREKLNWFERLPLFGKRIVVTRAREQADALSAQLRALGADVIELPTIEIRPAADYGPLDARHRRPARLRLADLHQRQRRALLPRTPGPLRRRPARPARAHLRHRPGHARRRRSAAPQGRPDGQGVRRRRPARQPSPLTTWPASASCCRAPRWRATWCPRNSRAAARAWTWWKPTARCRRTTLAERAREIFGAPQAGLDHVHQFLHRAKLWWQLPGAAALAACRWSPSARSPRQTARDLGIEVAAQAQAFYRRRVLSKRCSGCTLK